MPPSLSSKELAVIANIESHQNQRRLAEATGFSLGMTNLLLKRLVKKGYVKVTTLNGRTLKYMLTPSGFAQKIRRSYQYTLNSIRFLNEVRARIRATVTNSIASGQTVYLVGDNELADLAIDALREAGLPFVRLTRGEWTSADRALERNVVWLISDPEIILADERAAIDDSSSIIQLPGLMETGS